MSRYSHLSHRGLMKLTAAQNDLIIEMIQISRFYEVTGQQENANNAWARASEDYTKEIRKIKNEDRGVKE